MIILKMIPPNFHRNIKILTYFERKLTVGSSLVMDLSKHYRILLRVASADVIQTKS